MSGTYIALNQKSLFIKFTIGTFQESMIGRDAFNALAAWSIDGTLDGAFTFLLALQAAKGSVRQWDVLFSYGEGEADAFNANPGYDCQASKMRQVLSTWASEMAPE